MQIITLQAAKNKLDSLGEDELTKFLVDSSPADRLKLINDAASLNLNSLPFSVRILSLASKVPSIAMTPATRIPILNACFALATKFPLEPWANQILNTVLQQKIATSNPAVNESEESVLSSIIATENSQSGKYTYAYSVMLAKGTPQKSLDKMIEYFGLGGKVLAPAVQRRNEFWPGLITALDNGAVWQNEYMGFVLAQPLLNKGPLPKEYVEDIVQHSSYFPGIFISAVHENGDPELQQKIYNKPSLAEDINIIKQRISTNPSSMVGISKSFFESTVATQEQKLELMN